MGLCGNVVDVVLLTDVAIIETLIGGTQFIAVVQELLGTNGTTNRLHGTRVVIRGHHADTVPGTDAVVALSEVVSIAIPHAHHRADVRDGISGSLSILCSKCEDNLRTLYIVYAVEIAVVAVEAVVTIGAANNFLRERLTLVVVALANEDLSIEQQAGLEQTVHCLVYTIHHRVAGIVLSQGTSSLVKLGSNEAINLLTRGVPVRVSSTRYLAAGRNIQRQCTTPQLEDTVVVPST